MFPIDESVAILPDATLAFGRSYQLLREGAALQGIMAWNVTSKVHRMQHVPTMCTIINPRYISNYGEERAMGTHSRVWKKTIIGKYAGTIQRNVLIKRIVGLLLRFESTS